MPKPPPEVVKKRHEENQKVVTVLREAGLEVESVYDLVNDRRSFPQAVEPLLSILPKIDEPVIREGVVRALTDRAARGRAAKPLVEELRAVRENGDDLYGGVVGEALTVVADETVLEDLLVLAADEQLARYKNTLGALADVLARFKNEPRVVDTLITLLADDDVAGAALRSVRKLNATRARPQVERHLEHPEAWVRREARKTLEKFDKTA